MGTRETSRRGTPLQELLARALDNASYAYMSTQRKRARRKFYLSGIEDFLSGERGEDIRAFFPNPGAVPAVQTTDVTRRGAYDIHTIHYESFVDTPHRVNNTVHGRFYELHGRPDAPAVVVLHGYRMESYLVFDRYCRRFVRAGYNVALIDLPYHLHRRPAGTYHGEYTFSDDPVLTLKVMKQSVNDLQAMLNWLKHRGAPRVGMFGVSYGAMLSGVLGCVEPDLDFLIMIAPPADMGRVFFESRLGRQFESENPDARAVLLKYREVLDNIALPNLTPLVPRERIFIAEGLYDGMVPVDLIEKLWRAWGRPRIRRYPHGHISVIILNPQLDRDIKIFLKRISS